ncbi:putative KRUF family protein [Toxoplasma gondii ARI]|uniref:Putative KRUF family protein n=1 Tax=Toxoplasma gondii ARI TaxID=1074872 RepID=A0A139XI78_TOXGO|nr:putative KRUF family protein [Toxoplasma gondii ARI]
MAWENRLTAGALTQDDPCEGGSRPREDATAPAGPPELTRLPA